MKTAALVYPHQLFNPNPATDGADTIFLIEEPLFFRQYAFHRQKLMLHRATMQQYAREILPKARYVESHQIHETEEIGALIRKAKCRHVRVVDPCDDWLRSKLQGACDSEGLTLTFLPDPHFLTPCEDVESFSAGREKLYFTEFYIRQRKRLGVLLTPEGKPRDGKWSFDTENRRKLPASLQPPARNPIPENEFVQEARNYVREHFPNAPGSDDHFQYPTSACDARASLTDFLSRRFDNFGAYEDAISTRDRILFHSVLTPALNIGLLSPGEILDAALEFDGRVPMNSLEGFLRQVIGWREFVRLVYLTLGRRQRTRNFWRYHCEMPAGFYSATTGIEPVDHAIQAVLETGYCHHIERLMILGNFMLLCDIDPNSVYRWFMELFIDAYDWGMVPNVYGMSQHAGGGLMTTNPYISGSVYVLKMSDFRKGPWCRIWDALYGRFVDRHSDFFAANPRMAMMVRMKEKLGPKMKEHHRVAESFLINLHSGR